MRDNSALLVPLFLAICQAALIFSVTNLHIKQQNYRNEAAVSIILYSSFIVLFFFSPTRPYVPYSDGILSTIVDQFVFY